MALTQAPVLTTERLILRGPERSDLPAFSRFMTSAPSLIALGETISAEQAWYGFLTGIGHWHMHGFGFFTLVRRETGEPVGRVGLLRHHGWAETELAWHLFEEGEGQGFATEAAFEVKRWAFERQQVDPLHSYIDVDNARSQAVALRLGARRDGRRAAHDARAEVWVHDRSDA